MDRYSTVGRSRMQRNPRSMDFTALGKALADNQSLKVFAVDGYELDTLGLRGLCDGLATNKILQSLTLCGSTIDQEGMHMICRLISCTCSLKKLDLAACALDSRSIDLLCETIAGSTLVEDLSLYCIGNDKAVTRMGEMLLRNITLKSLSLSPKGKLSEASVHVKVHPSITKIQLSLIGRLSGGAVSLRQELDFYLELNRGPRSLLREDTSSPMGLWPLAFNRADACIRSDKTRQVSCISLWRRSATYLLVVFEVLLLLNQN